MHAAIPADGRPAAHSPAFSLNVSLSTLRHGALLSSAALLGFALILWIAANWDGIDKAGRFGIVAAAMAAGGLIAQLRPVLLLPGALVAFLATGGMLALIGQTYQTGADAWQLFALWSALGIPFALAARSDAVWSPWVAVSMTAVSLWQTTTDLTQLFQFMSRAQPMRLPLVVLMVASWLPGLAICAALSKPSPLAPWIGSRRWAFRLAMLLTMANIVTWSTMGVVGSGGAGIVFVLVAIAALLAIAFYEFHFSGRDPLLICAAALGIDVVLIVGLVRALLPSSSSSLPFFTIGVIAAGVIAVSVVAVLRVLKEPANPAMKPDVDPDADPDARPAPVPSASASQARPWPVVVLSALGAAMASLPLAVAIAILLGNALMSKGLTAYAIGALMIGIAVAMLLKARSLFVEQLATISLVLGMGLLTYALFRDFPDGAAGFVLAVVAFALAVTLGKPWLASLLGAVGTCGLAIAMARVNGNASVTTYLVTWGVLAAVWAAATRWLDGNRDWLEPLPSGLVLDAVVVGAVVAILLALSVGGGPTFLLDGMWGINARRVHAVTEGGFAWATPRQAVAVILAGGAAYVLLRAHSPMRTALGAVIALAGVVLAVFMPALGPVALILAVALTSGRRAVALLAVAAVLWILGNFYYALALTLTQKALILAATGAVLGGWALATRPADATADLLGALPGGSSASLSTSSRMLAALGLLVAGGLSAEAISSKEALIRNGSPVFVEMVPVDPRSLMQGDYMALRFRLPDGASREPSGNTRPHAVGKMDASGVAHLTRIAAARDPIGKDELRMELTRGNRGWTLVTNAWFFKEGTAKKWEAARYGEFRVLPDGRALLVGLADKDRQPIK